MKTIWLFWFASVVILASIIYELVIGKSWMRGVGCYSREKQPKAYWGSILLKVFVLGAIWIVAVLMKNTI